MISHDATNHAELADGVFRTEDPRGNAAFRLRSTERVSYDVVSVDGLLDPENPTLAEHNGNARVFCLIDRNVATLHGAALRAYFARHGVSAVYHELYPSEHEKTLDSVRRFASFCQDQGTCRRDHIVCIGGGITLDVGGLAANLIRRNMACIKIPTSLLAVVDAAVGVKTGVNFGRTKNYLGTYSAPTAVLYDLAFLRSLPEREIRNGLVEIIKMIALRSPEWVAELDRHLDRFFEFPVADAVRSIIEVSIQYMMEELQPNLRELELRRIVDYGHEFGHVIEVLTDHDLLHGEAVAIGMLMSNYIARDKGLMNAEDFSTLLRLHERLGLPFFHPRISGEGLARELAEIRRHKNGHLHLVVLERIGRPLFLNEVDEADVHRAARFLRAREDARQAAAAPAWKSVA
jgi:3-dehydroquinate synthase